MSQRITKNKYKYVTTLKNTNNVITKNKCNCAIPNQTSIYTEGILLQRIKSLKTQFQNANLLELVKVSKSFEERYQIN